MHLTQLLIGVILWPVMIAGTQATPPIALSAALRSHIQNERFDIVTSIRGLPLGVRDRLETMFRTGGLDIANPGTEFQGRATGNSKLPARRLIAAGCSSDHHCLVYYERAGTNPTWRIALFHWTPDESRLEVGGSAPGGLATVDDVRRAILSGAIKDSAGLW
jgi:hypothetical protein